jgi:uncharacterized membrane protein HdeD (DUF308 family)
MTTDIQTPPPPFPVARVLREDLNHLRDNWVWFLILGIALILLGMGAVAYSALVSVVAALFFGWFLVVGGIFHMVAAFFTRGWGGFFLGLLGGVLGLALGVIMIDRPAEAVLVYTLLLAAFFFVDGLFRIMAALAGRFRTWGWVLFSGVVSLLLGVLIWRQWPWGDLWVVGTFIGINMIFNGFAYVTLGLNARRLPV